MQSETLLAFVIDKIEDMKAKDIVTLDVKNKSTIADYMVVCTGTSKRHIQSIVEHMSIEAKRADMQPLGVEGKAGSDWVLIDLGDVILHAMQEEARDFYQLEKLWG